MGRSPMLCFLQARAHLLRALPVILAASISVHAARAEDAPKATEAKPAAAATPAKPESKFPDWNKTVEGAKQIDGLFTMYYNEKDQKLLMAIRREQFNQEF